MTTHVDPDRRRACCQVSVAEPHTLDCPELLGLQREGLAGADGTPMPAAPAFPKPPTLWRATLTVERVDYAAQPAALTVELVDKLDELPAMVTQLGAAALAILEHKASQDVNLRQLVELAYPQTGQASR